MSHTQGKRKMLPLSTERRKTKRLRRLEPCKKCNKKVYVDESLLHGMYCVQSQAVSIVTDPRFKKKVSFFFIWFCKFKFVLFLFSY